MSKFTKKEKLKILDTWLSKFPCKILGDYICILEFLNAKDIYDFIQQKFKEYKE